MTALSRLRFLAILIVIQKEPCWKADDTTQGLHSDDKNISCFSCLLRVIGFIQTSCVLQVAGV